MPFISFAQNFEDIMLWRALKHVHNGFYIDVGAAWPTEDSVTKAFYDQGWHGINIEPQPQLFKQLCIERPNDINLQLAVSDQPGTLEMSFLFDTGLSTLHADIASQHTQNGRQVELETVKVSTLNEITQKYVVPNQPIHFLKVDVEGHEESVLKGADWLKMRPWVVLVEATLPMSQIESYSQWEAILVSNGYFFAYADGINRFYIAQEHSELFAAFRYPPNVFDGFILVNQRRMSHERAEQAELSAQKSWQEVERAQAGEGRALAQAFQWQSENSSLQNEKYALEQQFLAQAFQWQSENSSLQNEKYALEQQLRAVFLSRSWKLTAPLRWYKFQVRRLQQDGLVARLKALFKKIGRKIGRSFSALQNNSAKPSDLTVQSTSRATQIYQQLQNARQQENHKDL